MLDKKTLDPLIQQELAEANKIHPQFASPHEGYAVLKEEVEETQEALAHIKTLLNLMWFAVRRDLKADKVAQEIYEKSMEVMAEAAQVGAMAKKFLNIK